MEKGIGQNGLLVVNFKYWNGLTSNAGGDWTT